MNETGPKSTVIISDTLRGYFDSTPDLVFFKDRNLVYLDASLSYAKLVGLQSAGEIAGKTDFDFFRDYSLANKYRSDDRHVIDSGESLAPYTEPFQTGDGKSRWITTIKFPIRDERGDIIGMCGIIRDNTELITLEKEKEFLEDSAERYRIALSNTNLAIWEYDIDRRRIIQSDRAKKKYGFPTIVENVPDSLVQTGYIHPDSVEPFMSMFQRLFDGERMVEGVFRVKSTESGEYWYEHVRYYLVLSDEGKRRRAIGMSEDVTDKYDSSGFNDGEFHIQAAMTPDMLFTLLIDVEKWEIVRSAFADDATRVRFEKNSLDEYITCFNCAMKDESPEDGKPMPLSRKALMIAGCDGTQMPGCEFKTKTADGRERYVRANVRLFIDPSNSRLMALLSLRDIDEQKRDVDRLRMAAQSDLMTNLLNHDTALSRMRQYVENDNPFDACALFMIDIDNFKLINDTLGHQKGDDVLIDAAKAITGIFRQTDIIGRVGGDEFLVLMKGVSSVDMVRRKMREVISALQFRIMGDACDMDMSVSVGTGMTSSDPKGFEQLYREADRALYQAKGAGKNRGVIFGDGEDGANDVSKRPVQSECAEVVQLHTLLRHMNAGVVVGTVGDEVRITYVSPSFYTAFNRNMQYLGGNENELLKKVYPEDYPVLLAEMRKAAESGRGECAYRVDDGALWRHIRMNRLPDIHDGADPMIIGVITDLTSIKTAEEELRQAQERYRIAMEKTRSMLWEVDLSTRTLYHSKEVTRFFGLGEDIVSNVPETPLAEGGIHPDNTEQYVKMYSDLYSGVEGGVYLLHLRVRGGEYMQFKTSFAYLRDDKGRPIKAIGVYEELANIEPDIRAFHEEERLMELVAPSIDGALSVNVTRNEIVYLHTRGKNSERVEYDSVIREESLLIPDLDERNGFLRAFSRENILKAYKRGESWLVHEHGRQFPEGCLFVNVTMKLIRHPASGDVYAFGFLRDINVARSLLLNTQQPFFQDEQTLLYGADTMRRVFNRVASGDDGADDIVVTVLEFFDAESRRRQDAVSFNKVMSTVGRLLRVVTDGSTIAGKLDEDRSVLISRSATTLDEYLNHIRNNIQHMLMILRQMYPERSCAFFAGVTTCAGAMRDFDEAIRQAGVACSMAHEFAGNPVRQYTRLDMGPDKLPVYAHSYKHRILVADDEPISRILLKNALKDSYAVDEAQNGAQAIEMIEKTDYSLVISDIMMPGKSGWDVLDAIREKGLQNRLPVIIITADDKPESQARALDMGASDVIVKPFMTLLLRSRVQNLISRQEAMRTSEENRLYQLRFEQQEQLLRSAQYDDVTGLYNRNAFYRRVREKLDENPGGKYAIIRWDMDNFKMLNDSLGAWMGDKVLRDIAISVQKRLPQGSVMARLERDHFAALVSREQVDLDGLYDQISGWTTSYPIEFRFSFRIGIYIIEDAGVEPSLMCDRAMLALLTVKNNFADHFAYYDESLRKKMLDEQLLISQMEAGLKNGEFALYYQPQFDFSDDPASLIGAEALVRWKHPQRGLLAPAAFIPLFEKNGLIMRLDQYVWEKACRQMRAWLDAGIRPVPVSVNVSRLNVYNPNLVNVITGLVKKYDLNKDLIHIEITESAYADDPELVINVVKELREAGLRVHMDDFGSGYSSLNSLKDVPVDVLKLDMRFLSEMDTENESRAGIVISSIVRMAHWLNLPVIAEGVENSRQVDYLRTIGCTLGQGYLFGRPVPVSDFELLMNSGKTGWTSGILKVDGHFDNDEFWSPTSLTTVVFNSFVGPSGIFEYADRKLEPVRLNDKYYAELQTTPSIIARIRDNVLVSVHPDDMANLIAALDEASHGNGEIHAEFRVLHRDFNIGPQWIRIRTRRIAQSGARYVLYMAFENITARRESSEREKRLIEATRRAMLEQQAENSRLRIILNLFNALVFEYDYDQDLLTYDVNLRESGYKRVRIPNYLKNLSKDNTTVHPDCLEDYIRQFEICRNSTSRVVFDYMVDNFGDGYRLNRGLLEGVADEYGAIRRLVGVVYELRDDI
ncbi:MAG: EAL domain-containing protein [Clostridia bacterium]|nr:EAL domain-containing protein [Clostridia bacterium]